MDFPIRFTINKMPSTKEYQREIRCRWKRAGLCSMCGVEKARLGLKTGANCAKRYREYHRSLKQQVFKAYGQKCVCCGCTMYEFLSLDHKNNDGKEDRQRLGTSFTAGAFYRRIIRLGFPPEYQVMCYNCNMSLGFFGYCPHHPRKRRLIRRSRG